MSKWRSVGVRESIVALFVLVNAGGMAAAQTATPADLSKIKPLPEKVTLHMASGGTNLNSSFVLYGIAKGYFQKENLDVQVQSVSGAAATTAPLLARGDLDIAPQSSSPSLYNLIAQGFGAKVIMPSAGTKAGRVQAAWMLLPPDKQGVIKDFSDLKGKSIDAAAIGGGIDFLVHEALLKANLDPDKDVKLMYRNRSAADFLTLAKSHSQDVIGMTEPSASQAERLGYDKRWVSTYDVAPWTQDLVMVASEQALQKKAEAIRKFVEVYIMVVREIDSTNGQWTSDLMDVSKKVTGMSEDEIRYMGGAPYIDPNENLSLDALGRTQQLWIQQKVLKQTLDVNQMVDLQPVKDALKVVGTVPVQP